MEEDIMILESECYYLEELGYLRENNHFIRFNQALVNLIKGYKDGEEIIKNTVKENLEYQKYIRELEENLKIATAMLTKGQYPEINKGDNDFNKQFVPKYEIEKLKKENEINIDKMRPYRHQGPFDFGVLNGIDECCRKLLEDK